MGMAISVPRFTVDDLDRLPDDGNRYELLDGTLLVTPSPTSAHQIVVNRLQWSRAAANRHRSELARRPRWRARWARRRAWG